MFSFSVRVSTFCYNKDPQKYSSSTQKCSFSCHNTVWQGKCASRDHSGWLYHPPQGFHLWEVAAIPDVTSNQQKRKKQSLGQVACLSADNLVHITIHLSLVTKPQPAAKEAEGSSVQVVIHVCAQVKSRASISKRIDSKEHQGDFHTFFLV